MSLFQKGQQKIGGRTKGVRNKRSKAFDDALWAEFESGEGQEVMRLARVERPNEFLKLVASRFPAEFEVAESRLRELSDNELDALAELAKRLVGGSNIASDDSREETVLN